jgi:hypothetical protein
LAFGRAYPVKFLNPSLSARVPFDELAGQTFRRSPMLDKYSRRPREATVAGALLIGVGLLIMVAVALEFEGVRSRVYHGAAAGAQQAYALLAIQFILSGTQTASGIFLLHGKEWARRTAITICIVSLLGGIIAFFNGFFQAIVGVVINIALIVMLRRYEVSDWTR